MVWYRSPAAYDEKFGRRLQPPAEGSLLAEVRTLTLALAPALTLTRTLTRTLTLTQP